MKLCIAFLLSITVLAQGRSVQDVQTDLAVQNDPNTFSELRCHGINGGCCTDNNPCGVGDGDCDYDSHCARDLVCGESNCKFPGGDDCCMERPLKKFNAQCQQNLWAHGDGKGGSEESIGKTKSRWECVVTCNARRKTDKSINGCTYEKSSGDCYTEHQMTYVGGSTSYDTCYLPYIDSSGLRCQGADNGCCTKETPCGLNDGDCDSNEDCAKGLYCHDANCAWGNDDCCMEYNSVGDEETKEMTEVPKEDEKTEEMTEDSNDDDKQTEEITEDAKEDEKQTEEIPYEVAKEDDFITAEY